MQHSDCVRLLFNNDPDAYVISLHEEGSCLALDASASSDPENEILTFPWTFPAAVLPSSEAHERSRAERSRYAALPMPKPSVLNGLKVTNCFTRGCQPVSLVVSDGMQGVS